MEAFCHLSSPLGRLTAASDGEAVTGLWIEGQAHFAKTLNPMAREMSLPIWPLLQNWLAAYFRGEQPPISFPLAPKGSAFQQSVWKMLRDLPYGSVTTYGAISRRLCAAGAATSARAVGSAVARNPIMILIPCHRVVGAHGRLTGYAGGLERKIQLLQLENVAVDSQKQTVLSL